MPMLLLECSAGSASCFCGFGFSRIGILLLRVWFFSRIGILLYGVCGSAPCSFLLTYLQQDNRLSSLQEKEARGGMKKVLYVDTPFQGLRGGDKNRSQFLWDSLCSEYDADLLLLKTQDYNTKALPPHSGYRKSFSLVISPAAFYQPQAIHHFHPSQLRKFEQVLRSEQYEMIVFRFLSCYHLAETAAEVLPEAEIAIDVDMLFSRISELSWQQNKSLQNRYHLVEMLKLKAFEKKAFQADFRFFFTNPVELRLAVQTYGLAQENALLCPNVMPGQRMNAHQPELQNYILFFGTLSSMANQDAFDYLCTKIYPLIEADLQAQNCLLRIAGKGGDKLTALPDCPYLDIVGEVEDMAELIASSRFVILPLRIASGTRTRILEAAAVSKAVITTSLGLEGLDLDSEVMLANEPEDFAEAVISLLQDDETARQLGEKLQHKATLLYSPENVAKAFLQALESEAEISSPELQGSIENNEAKAGSLRLALVTNRFYPEVGGAETNIYYQARKLAEKHQVTVFCPKRQAELGSGKQDNFTVLRLPDLLNMPPQYPNLKAKTFCPTLLWKLLKGNYDVIQCFPALNYNNMLAFLAAKLRGIPFILCFFDFIDYAALIKTEGRINPNVLRNLQIPWYQKLILKRLDFAFAISQKEIDFLKSFTPRIAYSPVPVLIEEYEQELPDPHPALGIKKSDFAILCLGRVSQLKGQDIALKAFAQIARAIPEAKLVFVGRTDYEPNFYAGLQSLVADHNLLDRVFFTGMLDRREVLAWLKYADLHLIPVRFMNSGAVVVESWISGTPVLQSNVVDPNLVVEGENGYLFRSEDYLDCATKLRLAYQKRKELPSLAAKGKELVLQKYTYDYLIGLYEKTYQYLLES
jgi:glycosyltransferase involved in cell wall biosynthesis